MPGDPYFIREIQSYSNLWMGMLHWASAGGGSINLFKKGVINWAKNNKICSTYGRANNFYQHTSTKKNKPHTLWGEEKYAECALLYYILGWVKLQDAAGGKNITYIKCIWSYAATVIPRGFPQYLQFTKPSQIFNIHYQNRPLCALTSSVL